MILGDHVTSGSWHRRCPHRAGSWSGRLSLSAIAMVWRWITRWVTTVVFLPDTGLFAGLHVFKANPEIIKVLEERATLVHQETLEHSYPHCWRHKSPIIFRSTPQWFISMDANGLRDEALQSIKGVAFEPAWGEERIEGMVSGRPDWCISRQRTWGRADYIVHSSRDPGTSSQY